MLERLKAVLPNAPNDSALAELIDQCVDEFKAICSREDVPAGAESVIVQMAVYRYNQLGAEGLTGQAYSGMSESYLADYPERLKRAMYRFRRVRLL